MRSTHALNKLSSFDLERAQNEIDKQLPASLGNRSEQGPQPNAHFSKPSDYAPS